MDKTVVYYELSPAAAERFGGVRYWYSHETRIPRSYTFKQQLMYMSDRAWMQCDDTVFYLKNRTTPFNPKQIPVDMREFFIVQLRSRLYDGDKL
jgi:hypothetical protein